MQTIVIIGGGAGGLELATRLGNQLQGCTDAKVILIDRAVTHFWKPLLHAVASGTLDPHVHQLAYAAQAAEHHFEFVCGSVTAVDRQHRTVQITAGYHDNSRGPGAQRYIHYDKLVLAVGAVTNFFNIPGAAEHALSLDTVQHAEGLRKRFIMECMRASSRKIDGTDPHAKVNIVIVGGGATGVELAAELRHTARTLSKYKVHALDPVRDVHIRVIERSDRLLAHLNPELSQKTMKFLRALSIEISTSTTVASVDAEGVHDSTGHCHDSNITVWAAGVQGPTLCATLDLPMNRLNQLLVTEDLQTAGDRNVFAIGDCSSYVCPIRGAAVPPRAQVAHQQAIYLAKALALPEADAMPQFQYQDYGSLVSLGAFTAVGVLIGNSSQRELVVGGWTARLLYRLMYQKHLFALHGFMRMAAWTLAHWIRARVTPAVKLH